MNTAAQEARRKYKREWNRQNRDKVKKHQETYWERRAQRESQAQEAQQA